MPRRTLALGCTRALATAVLLSTSAIALPSAATRADDSTFYDETRVPRLRLIFPTPDWHQRLQDNKGNGRPIRADLILDGVLFPDVGVQHKGDASYTGRLRESMKILLDWMVPGQEYQGFDIITLDASRQSSVFHEVAALWVIGEFTDVPRANLAHLVAGTVDDPLDLGVFTSTERVDAGFARRHFGLAGHRYVVNDTSDNTYPPLTYEGDDPDDYRGHYTAQGGDLGDVWHDVADAAVALHNAPDDRVREQVDPYVDIDAAMRVLIGNRMVANADGIEIGNNYYMLEDKFHSSRLVMTLWDLDLAWVRRFSNPIPDTGGYPLAKIFETQPMQERARAFVVQSYRKSYRGRGTRDRLWALYDRVIHLILGSRYEEYDNEAEVAAEVGRILSTLRDTREVVEADPRFTRDVPLLEELRHTPAMPREGQDVWVSVRASVTTTTLDQVLLWSRARGHFQPVAMEDDGAHHDGAAGDGVWGARLPAAGAGDVVEYYVEARPLDLTLAGYAYSPETTEYRPASARILAPPAGNVRLTELVSDNETGDLDEAGDADDWVEIANLGAFDVDLGGGFLSDSIDLRKWRFPVPTVIPASGRIRVWCDEEPTEGPLHASFKLSKDGERLTLSAPDAAGGGILDEIEFPALEADQAFGRVPDASAHWFYVEDPGGDLPCPTPGIARRYDAREDGSALDFKLRLTGDLREGGSVAMSVQGGVPATTALLVVSGASDRVDVGALGYLGVMLGQHLVFSVPLDAGGDADLTAAIPVGLAGAEVYVQALGLGLDLSRASAFTIAP